MNISLLIAFFVDDNPIITKLIKSKIGTFKLAKKGIVEMVYKVNGYIIDSRKYLVKVFDFIISLECIYSYEYSNNKEFIFKDGDWVTFVVDRFDVVI